MAAVSCPVPTVKFAGSGAKDSCCTRRKERGADENSDAWHRCGRERTTFTGCEGAIGESRS